MSAAAGHPGPSAEDAAAGQREERRARQLERLRFWRRACADERPDVTVFPCGDGGRPLVFFHGDYEAGGTYLARLAGDMARPLVGIAPHGMHGDVPPASVEAMAADRIPRVLASAGAGPYRLGGYCNGALLAYEVARQMSEAGHGVECVIMVEPPSLSVRPGWRLLHRAVSWASRRVGGPAAGRRAGKVMHGVSEANRISHSSSRQLWGLVRLRLARMAERRSRPSPEEAGRRGRMSEGYIEAKGGGLARAYAEIVPAYLPPRSGFPVVVMSSGRDAAGRRCALYDGRGWRHVCSDFAHVALEGSHLSCLMETTDRLALAVVAVLDRETGAGSRAMPAGKAPAAARAATGGVVLARSA